MNKPVVLVVDDSEICLEVARDALVAAGFRVVTSQSPLGVSRLLRHSEARVVVLDVGMPALSGDKLVQILRKATADDLAVILHSDRPMQELVAIGERCGATTVARKDPDCASLVAAVRRVLVRRPSHAGD
jgi:DNA-binding response OmpR family regulator